MTEGSTRRGEAALRPVGGVEEIQVIGALQDSVVALLGVATSARSVWLHPNAVAHIEEQRRTAPGDAEFVLQHLVAAIHRPTWVTHDVRDPRKARLVHRVEQRGRYLHVALKFVPAAEASSVTDEVWVGTAYPMGRSSLTRLRRAHTLIAVPGTDP